MHTRHIGRTGLRLAVLAFIAAALPRWAVAQIPADPSGPPPMASPTPPEFVAPPKLTAPGVITPPSQVDRGIQVPTPNMQGGAMPILPPPGTPGGDALTKPK